MFWLCTSMLMVHHSLCCSLEPHPPSADYSSLVLTAEQSLERKWRKYFGGDVRLAYSIMCDSCCLLAVRFISVQVASSVEYV